VQESAVPIIALLIAKEGRTIFRCSVLRPEHPIAISGTVHSVNAHRSIGFARESHVNTNSLVRVAAGLSLADHNFLNFAILTEIFPSTERLEELIFVSDRRVEADNVDQVLLDDTDAGQVLPTGSLDFTLFGFLLFGSSRLAMFQRQICLEPNHSRLVGMWRRCHRVWADSLFDVRDLVLDGTFIVSAPTVRASSFFILRLNIVVAELANLERDHHMLGLAQGDKGESPVPVTRKQELAVTRQGVSSDIPDIHKDTV
jgi:hypothetical protein